MRRGGGGSVARYTEEPPRLIECAEKRERLKRAVVLYEGQKEGIQPSGAKLSVRKVKRVWGAHRIDGTEHVHVLWVASDGSSEAVVPVAWLTDNWEVRVPSDREAVVCLRTFSAVVSQGSSKECEDLG